MKIKISLLSKFLLVSIVFTLGCQKPSNDITVLIKNGVSIEFVTIPSAEFMMGTPITEQYRHPDETEHKVILDTFRMSKYEVTFEQYDAFCDSTGREKPDDEGWGRGKRPVINVDWHDAVAFAEWMSCRLPTEAEWEYACRAGTNTPFNTGNKLKTSQANYRGDTLLPWKINGIFREKTLPVGSFEPNKFELHDMHGNVSEWCSDWYGEYPNGLQINPTGVNYSIQSIVFRGGCWNSVALTCRSAYRNGSSVKYTGNDRGFRLVVDELKENNTGFFKDRRDGKTYKYTKIGNQIWMAENLRYKPETGNYWVYENDEKFVENYGYLYDWETALKCCPDGWHLPTDSEWAILEIYLGMSLDEAAGFDERGTDEGEKLKSNEYNFNASLGGRHSYDGFDGRGFWGHYWTATKHPASHPIIKHWRVYRFFGSNMKTIGRFSYPEEEGYSVRCIKD